MNSKAHSSGKHCLQPVVGNHWEPHTLQHGGSARGLCHHLDGSGTAVLAVNLFTAFALMQVTSSDVVLELGCSYGMCTNMLAEHAAHVTGIDNSEEVVAEVRSCSVQQQASWRPPCINICFRTGSAAVRALHVGTPVLLQLGCSLDGHLD